MFGAELAERDERGGELDERGRVESRVGIVRGEDLAPVEGLHQHAVLLGLLPARAVPEGGVELRGRRLGRAHLGREVRAGRTAPRLARHADGVAARALREGQGVREKGEDGDTARPAANKA